MRDPSACVLLFCIHIELDILYRTKTVEKERRNKTCNMWIVNIGLLWKSRQNKKWVWVVGVKKPETRNETKILSSERKRKKYKTFPHGISFCIFLVKLNRKQKLSESWKKAEIVYITIFDESFSLYHAWKMFSLIPAIQQFQLFERIIYSDFGDVMEIVISIANFSNKKSMNCYRLLRNS